MVLMDKTLPMERRESVVMNRRIMKLRPIAFVLIKSIFGMAAMHLVHIGVSGHFRHDGCSANGRDRIVSLNNRFYIAIQFFPETKIMISIDDETKCIHFELLLELMDSLDDSVLDRFGDAPPINVGSR